MAKISYHYESEFENVRLPEYQVDTDFLYIFAINNLMRYMERALNDYKAVSGVTKIDLEKIRVLLEDLNKGTDTPQQCDHG